MKTQTKKEILGNTENISKSKFVARNTVKIELKTGTVIYRLHNTDIVTYCGPDTIILNSGKFRTNTTKERINRFAPVHLSQNKGLWYIDNGKLFYDNCVINSKGQLISKPLNNTKIENQAKKLKKQISDYCKLITKDNLPYPDNGDCWDCAFHTKEGLPMGEINKNYDHLLTHLKEKYLFGSILVNAMKETGYSDTGIGLHYQMKYFDTFRRSVRKYLQKRLIANLAVK